MIRSRPLTCIIPARGGSKGIAHKNLRKLGGDTLVERAIKLAKAEPRVDRILVSTDDRDIQAIATRHGVAAPALRPAHLADDDAQTFDVVADLVEQAGIEPGAILLLQPTTPLRSRADLGALLDRFESDGEASAIVSLCEPFGNHPMKAKVIRGGRVCALTGMASDQARQGLEQAYELNGAFYLIDRDVLLKTGTFLPPDTLGYVMAQKRSINLDTMTDWQILNAMVAQGHWQIEKYD